VGAFGDLVQKAGRPKIYHATQSANHLALMITNGYGNTEDWRPQFLAHHQSPDGRSALLQRSRHGIDVQIIGANPPGCGKTVSNHGTVCPVGDDAAVEEGLKNRAVFEESLHGRSVAQHGRGKSFDNFFQRTQAVTQLLIDVGGE
jgi:hypothetical protein